ncbi:hypothetical protein [Litchfieldia salsa]|uniref:Uncharacterized protein n=1 Tax=Litchfieldia salsa TaxID=930152 RepID=A0A1H0SMA6_9BACI|nr:hypothetical protein [Litchfieldia salsa]SDP42689.1 hypothetical protein SAMN05216565_1035 [Litchfieldia salsa]
MGFDIMLYDNNGKQVELFELTERLHNEIFNSTKLWRSYIELRKLSDYYLTDETLSGERLITLITDLKNYQRNISQDKQMEYQELIDKLSTPIIRKAHIAGD